MIHRGLHTRERQESKGWKSIAWCSTPVYAGTTMVGRDVEGGGWFRTFQKGGMLFYYHGVDDHGGPFDGGPCKTRAAAARLASRLFMKT